MKFDESARIGIAAVIILALAFLVSVLSPSASAFAAIIFGLALCVILYRKTPQAEPLLTPSIDRNDPYEAALDAVADPLMLLSATRVIHANAAALTLFGSQLEGQDIRLAIRHSAISTLLSDPIATGIAEIGGQIGMAEIWEVRITRVGDDKRLIHMIDQSARYAAERARVDFVANASHELRTPLANIAGYVETLADDAAGDDPPTRARFLSIIASETRRLSALVEDLMSLSRIEADKHHEPETIIDLSPLVARIVGERNDPIQFERPSRALSVKGDTAQLSQLIHNLIDNAFKYGKPGGRVTVETNLLNDGHIRLSIIDEGIGIAAADIPRLTERFYRVDAGRSQSVGGTGLGLSIVKHIAERHRALLNIESVIGSGTTVSVTFANAAEAVT